MAMKMEWMLAAVCEEVRTMSTSLYEQMLTEVIDNDLYNLVVVQNERMRKFSINHRICRVVSSRHHCIKRWYFLWNVCNVVEESTIKC